nr:MAG TPA: hypothetical protein [Caudoviricetes sp.]
MRIETKTENRKAMVQAIGEFLVKEAHYMGPPTFSYTVGSLIIDRDGVITSETDDGEELLMQFLTEKGYVEVPTEELNIQVPYDTDNPTALRNIIAMLHARAYLLNRITRHETFSVSDSFLNELEQLPEENSFEAFQTALSAATDALKGVSFAEGVIAFTFPLSKSSAKNRAYAELCGLMAARAKEAKRCSAEPVVQENEKYYLRIWFIQLGLSGKDSKESRKALLDGLNGHTAFRTKDDADRFSAAQKEKRMAAKAARLAAQESEDHDDDISE